MIGVLAIDLKDKLSVTAAMFLTRRVRHEAFLGHEQRGLALEELGLVRDVAWKLGTACPHWVARRGRRS